MKRLGLGIVAMWAAVGCGNGPETTSSGPADDTMNEVPTAVFQDGIYVAAFDGSDLNDGSPLAPMKSIGKAVEHAAATGKKDVWIYGGAFNGGYAEVVVLRPGINLHGSICKTDAAPATADTTNCLTSIAGGSPSLVAIDVRENTIVENLEVLGLPGVQSGGPNDGFFEVAGIGCIGRGINNGRLPACDRPVDAEGRMTPFSSVAVALSRSNAVFFRNVSVVAGDGASGLDGAEGVMGTNASQPSSGAPAGDKPYKAGAGAMSIAQAACPDAIGGRGGQGGRFQWSSNVAWSESNCDMVACGTLLQLNYVHGGNNGEDSFLHSENGVAFAPSYQGFQAGLDGANGSKGLNGGISDPGIPGVREIDLVTLSAGEGLRGDFGHSGHGGAGGSGGHPATRSIWKKKSGTSSSSVSFFAIAGSNSGGYSGSMVQSNVGELAGGGGGAGGAGGCGGEGGVGGQGGAASVGIYLVDSTLGAELSTVATGRGGAGGRGGQGGEGGIGANGSEGGAGRSVEQYLVNGKLTTNSSGGYFSILTGDTQTSDSFEDGKSAARSGKGGTGGAGGKGGNGGAGGAGAGGSSIGVVAKGESAVTGAITYTLGESGAAGSESGEAGVAVELLSL